MFRCAASGTEGGWFSPPIEIRLKIGGYRYIEPTVHFTLIINDLV